MEANNYIKVSRGCAIVGTFPFNDGSLASATEAQRRALELLHETMVDAARRKRERTNPRAPGEVVRMSVYRQCECLDGYVFNFVGVWRCHRCHQAYDTCRCPC